MNNKKSIVLVIGLSLSSNTLYSIEESIISNENNIPISELRSTCLPFDINKLNKAITEKKQICLQNPFDEKKNIPFSFTRKDEELLTLSDFDNSRGVYQEYLNFVNFTNNNYNDEVMVSQIYLNESKVYKFFRFIEDSQPMKIMKNRLSRTSLKGDENLFVFFHELMHLSPNHNHVLNDKIHNNQTEAAADLGASLMITLKNGYDLDKTIKYINDVDKIRRVGPTNTRNNAEFRKLREEHYSRSAFNNIKENLKTEEFKTIFEELKKLNFNEAKDFNKLIVLVEELAFAAQYYNKEEFVRVVHSMVNNKDVCKDFNISQLLQEMKNSKEFFAKNIFHSNECMLYVLNTNHTPLLTENDFKDKRIFKDYMEFITDSKSMVRTIYNPNTGQYYQIFKVDENDRMYQQMKQNWTRTSKNLTDHFDDFIKLHELAHTDRSKIGLTPDQMETLADISATILISFNRGFNIKETINFLEGIQKNRVKERKFGFRDQFGNNIKDDHHYDRKFFEAFLKDLKQLPYTQKLNETDTFINVKEDQVVSFIKSKYIK